MEAVESSASMHTCVAMAVERDSPCTCELKGVNQWLYVLG